MKHTKKETAADVEKACDDLNGEVRRILPGFVEVFRTTTKWRSPDLDAELLALLRGSPAKNAKPASGRMSRQQDAIVNWLLAQGADPTNLTYIHGNASWKKICYVAVKSAFDPARPGTLLFPSKKSFNHAWDELRNAGRVRQRRMN